MPDDLTIQSHKGPYSAHFIERGLINPDDLLQGTPHFIIDGNVSRIYANQLAPILNHPNTIIIEATEENKSIEKVIPVIARLVENKVRRDHCLVAVGGGIIQDITCFIASTLLRGVPWKFVPTTLLAQADSCIGSKSSINLGRTKNILGTFNPPREIFVSTEFLNTLERKEILSGIGEILKVHAIDGAEAYDRLASDYDALFSEPSTLLRGIHHALGVKKRFIEVDEFDAGIRNIFNYGHSFGHAIESATDFGIPHGVAVTMGMDIANKVSEQLGKLPTGHYQRMTGVLRKNFHDFRDVPISLDDMLSALGKDKKNTAEKLVLILPVGDNADIQRVEVTAGPDFRQMCGTAMKDMIQ